MPLGCHPLYGLTQALPFAWQQPLAPDDITDREARVAGKTDRGGVGRA